MPLTKVRYAYPGLPRPSKQQHKPNTHELHSGNCKTLKRFFRGQWLDEITQGMVEDFKLTRIREKRWGERDEIAVSGVTVNRALSTLRLVCNCAEHCGFRVSDPVKHVAFFRETGRSRIISPQEEQVYLAATSQPLRDIARTMLDTRTRPAEDAAAMDLLHHGVDRSVIALGPGHESVEATQMYLDADMRLKEKALSRTEPLGVKPARYRPDDELLGFLESP
jgi:hypothetical protein